MPSLFEKLFKAKTAAAGPSPAPAAPASSRTPTSAAPESPSPFDTLFAQATAAAAARDLERALRLYDQAIAADPSRAESYYKRANALKDMGRLQEALASYDQAIERKPDYAYAFCNRAVVQQSLGALDAALASYDQAIAIDPDDPLAHNNRALLLQLLYRWDEALASYDRAIAINPDYADAHYNRSLTALFLGDFASGWPDYEWRQHVAQRINIAVPREFNRPQWRGDAPIAGKRLLVYSEQGLGDTLQFCRYVTLAAAQGAIVIVEVQASLVSLLKSLEGAAQVIARGSPLPPFDCHCSLMSLPLAFKTTLESIPAPGKYLHPSPGAVAAWRAALGAGGTPRIGLVWSGNPNNAIDSRRSLPLARWIPKLPRGPQYFRLQNDVRPADQEALDAHPFIVSPGEFTSFEDTAAFCECLDLLVCVDTSVAHLGGALGKPTWMLIPYVPDWRWMRERTDTPWYPNNVTLYRQQRAGDWDELLDRVAADLRREIPVG
jgi:tetratricopeptide (TPR) repeat protein